MFLYRELTLGYFFKNLQPDDGFGEYVDDSSSSDEGYDENKKSGKVCVSSIVEKMKIQMWY